MGHKYKGSMDPRAITYIGPDCDRGITMSFSKWKTITRCYRQAYYKYILKLRKKSKGVALAKGSLIHECIEAMFLENDYNAIKKPIRRFKNNLEELFEEERVQYEDIPGEVMRIMRGYRTTVS